MAVPGRGYSRFVAWAKVILPLIALALFATMFLVARRIDPDAAIPFADVDVEQFAREARIGAPRYSGVTGDGTVIALSAEVARPDLAQPSRMTAEGLSATFAPPDGSRLEATARTGVVDSAARRVDLAGGVEIRTSTGYRIAAQGLTAELAETGLRSDGPVTADGPPGRIEAGAMAVARAPAAEGAEDAYVLVFSDGVKLIYDPAGRGGAE